MYKYIKNIAIIIALCLSLEAKDFVVNCDKCVIEIGSSDEEVEYFKKEMGEEDFYVAADDANYYAYTLSKYLETNGIEFKHVARLDSHRTKLVFPNEGTIIMTKNNNALGLERLIPNALKYNPNKARKSLSCGR